MLLCSVLLMKCVWVGVSLHAKGMFQDPLEGFLMGLGVALLSEVSPPARVAPFIAMVTTPSHRTQSIIIMPLDLGNQATPQVEVSRHAPLSHTPYLCSPISVLWLHPPPSPPGKAQLHTA